MQIVRPTVTFIFIFSLFLTHLLDAQVTRIDFENVETLAPGNKLFPSDYRLINYKNELFFCWA